MVGEHEEQGFVRFWLLYTSAWGFGAFAGGCTSGMCTVTVGPLLVTWLGAEKRVQPKRPLRPSVALRVFYARIGSDLTGVRAQSNSNWCGSICGFFNGATLRFRTSLFIALRMSYAFSPPP